MFGPGDIIHNRFEVEDLFFGGMAEVYVAVDKRSKQKFALKAPRDEFLRGGKESVREWRSRFEREARNWISLGVHDNIVQAYSYIDAPKPILVLEYVDGYDLDKIVKQEPGGMSISQAVAFATEIAAGLEHAHVRKMPRGPGGLIHRDLKPSNVLVTRRCQAKIADFGLSRAKGDTRWTRHFVGSMAYAPPEQFENANSVTHKADIYSFGVILYEMLTGNLPFLPCETKKMIRQIFHDDPEPFDTYRADVPTPLRDLVYRCLAKHPVDRPGSSRTLLEELRALKKGLHQDATTPTTCGTCGYRSEIGHVKCPVCDAVTATDHFEVQGQTWICACGLYVPERYRFCISCGLPSVLLKEEKRTTKMPSSISQEVFTDAGIEDSKRSCGECGKDNPFENVFCSRCGSQLRFGDSTNT